MKSPESTDQLARAYREARVLVLGDRSPKVDRAFALHRDFDAIRAGFLDAPNGSRSGWEAQLLERTRRATIVALRYQAQLVGDRWTESTSPDGSDPSTVHVNPEHALQLANAALELHSERDPDKARTTEVVESIRRKLAQVTSPPLPLLASERTSRAHTQPVQDLSQTSKAVLAPTRSTEPSNDNLIPTRPSPPGREDRTGPSQHMRRASSAPLFFRRASVSIAVLAVAGVAFFAISSGKNGSAVTSRTRQGLGRSVVREVQTSLPTPNAVRSIAAPETGVAAVRQPEIAVPVVSVLLRSKPSGARVTVKGEFRGTTPLRLEGHPRDQLSVRIQKGDLLWRGTLVVNDTREQTVNVTLIRPTLPQTPRPRSTSARLAAAGPYEAALRSGIELYKQGWLGPAIGRFKQAVAINPRSAEAYLWWGRALKKANRHAEARRALEQVIVLAQTGPLADEATSLLKRLP